LFCGFTNLLYRFVWFLLLGFIRLSWRNYFWLLNWFVRILSRLFSLLYWFCWLRWFRSILLWLPSSGPWSSSEK
jgi:hypothetical protein